MIMSAHDWQVVILLALLLGAIWWLIQMLPGEWRLFRRYWLRRRW